MEDIVRGIEVSELFKKVIMESIVIIVFVVIVIVFVGFLVFNVVEFVFLVVVMIVDIVISVKEECELRDKFYKVKLDFIKV